MRFLTCWLLLASTVAAAERPDILLIAVDDLRVDLGCYGSPDVLSPNIDRLAARSVRFHRAYCQQAVCNPSRASLLTGRRPDHLRIWNLATHFREHEPQIVSLPERFRQAGYFTQGIGKIFHNWRQKIKGDPQAWSVPQQLHFNTHYADTPQIAGQLPPNLARVGKNECRDVPDDAYFDGRVADQAVAAVKERSGADQPFFLAVGFWKPHLPFNAPKKYWDLFDRDALQIVERRRPPEGAPEIALHDSRELLNRLKRRPTEADVRELRHGYLAAIAYLDAQVGKVLDALADSPAAESTIIVFWSDHGFHLGEHDLWCKTSNFELDARVPLMIAVPEMQQAGRSTDTVVELLDVYPTLVDLAGLEAPAGLQGRSLQPLLQNPQQELARHAFTQHPRPAYYTGTLPDVMGYSVRSDRYRYTEWREMTTARIVGRELYDHAADEDETVNVVEHNQHVAAQLADQLRRVFPDRRWQPDDVRPSAATDISRP